MDLLELFEPLSNAEKISVVTAVVSLLVSIVLPCLLFWLANRGAKKREKVIDNRAQKALDISEQIATLKAKEHELKLQMELTSSVTLNNRTYWLLVWNYSEGMKTLIRASLLNDSGEVVCTTAGGPLLPHKGHPSKIRCNPVNCDGQAICEIKYKVEPDGEFTMPIRLDGQRYPLDRDASGC